MEIRQLEYLVAVVEAASFSAAARKLGVRQPTISEQIRSLETQLKQPLLDRLPGRVVPTAAGRQLVDHARRILAEVADANRRVGDASRVAGPLTVGAIPTIAPFLFPKILKGFEAAHPDVELTLVEQTTDVLLARLLAGEIDLAITSTIPPTANLHSETIAEEELVLLLPANHPLAKRPSVTAKMLDDERFVALHEMHCLADQSAKFCLRSGLNNPTVMQGSNLFTLALMVAAGAGISLVPQMMARSNDCQGSGWTFKPFGKNPPKRELTIVWSLLRYRPQSARLFADSVRGVLSLEE